MTYDVNMMSEERAPDTRQANVLTVLGGFDVSRSVTELRLDDGRVLRVPTVALLESEAEERETDAFEAASRPDIGIAAGEVIPVVEEVLTVGKRTVATGIVRVRKTVQEYHETLDEPLAVRTFDVERVILNRPIDTAPEIRHEGDTTIYPLVEEQLVMTKQLILREEIHVTRRDAEKRDNQTVTLRREHVTVEREPLRE